MAEIVIFEHMSLRPHGPTLTLALPRGHSLGVIGLAASGKTRLLRVVVGLEKPARGKVQATKHTATASRTEFSRRLKPQTIAREAPGGAEPDRVAEVLSGLGLWEHRLKNLGELTDSQLCACELIVPLMGFEELLILDGQLDRLDPVAMGGALSLIQSRMRSGTAVIAATNRLDFASKFDTLLVLRDSNLAFAGSTEELLRSSGEATVEVVSERQLGVRALADPFEVTVQEREDGLVFTSSEGQALAAKMLVEGYGDVKYVVLKQPSIEEAILKLISR